MKYFFLSLFIVVVFAVGLFGFRGEKFALPPFELFPDMDHQDRVGAQEPNSRFANGSGSRLPVAGAVPQAFSSEVSDLSFSEGRAGYYYTGELEGTLGNGMPEELEINDESASRALLSRGKERFAIHCAPCHGTSGNGKGVIAQYEGMAGIVASIHNFPRETHPDGHIYKVIAHGKGNMGGYKHNLSVRDRWAIVAHVRVLQEAQKN